MMRARVFVAGVSLMIHRFAKVVRHVGWVLSTCGFVQLVAWTQRLSNAVDTRYLADLCRELSWAWWRLWNCIA